MFRNRLKYLYKSFHLDKVTYAIRPYNFPKKNSYRSICFRLFVLYSISFMKFSFQIRCWYFANNIPCIYFCIYYYVRHFAIPFNTPPPVHPAGVQFFKKPARPDGVGRDR